MGWTRQTYDKMGRLTAVDHYDGAAMPPPWGGNTPLSGSTQTYDGLTTTISDEAAKSRKQTVDALGRLVSVAEDPTGLNYSTTYGYDALNNLKQVIQGSQTRTFLYDSLSRLYSAVNPESGTTTYTYDDNGNLYTKAAPNATTTIMSDQLNRVSTKSYSDGTPMVTYCYDAITLGACAGAPTAPFSVGRLTSVSAARTIRSPILTTR